MSYILKLRRMILTGRCHNLVGAVTSVGRREAFFFFFFWKFDAWVFGYGRIARSGLARTRSTRTTNCVTYATLGQGTEDIHPFPFVRIQEHTMTAYIEPTPTMEVCGGVTTTYAS